MAKKTAFPTVSAAATAYFTENGLDSLTEAVAAFVQESGFPITDATLNNIRQTKYRLMHKSKPGRRGRPKKTAATHSPETTAPEAAPKAKRPQRRANAPAAPGPNLTFAMEAPQPKMPTHPATDERESLRRMILKVGTTETLRILESLE
jgi:hypothetical protein